MKLSSWLCQNAQHTHRVYWFVVRGKIVRAARCRNSLRLSLSVAEWPHITVLAAQRSPNWSGIARTDCDRLGQRVASRGSYTRTIMELGSLFGRWPGRSQQRPVWRAKCVYRPCHPSFGRRGNGRSCSRHHFAVEPWRAPQWRLPRHFVQRKCSWHSLHHFRWPRSTDLHGQMNWIEAPPAPF